MFKRKSTVRVVQSSVGTVPVFIVQREVDDHWVGLEYFYTKKDAIDCAKNLDDDGARVVWSN